MDDSRMSALVAQAMRSDLLSAAYRTYLLRRTYEPSLTSPTQSGLQRYTICTYIALVLIVTTFIIIIFTIYFSCRPFHNYWQINPDPGNACTAAVSKNLIWVTFIFNVLTDVYLLLIPVPMLWKSSLEGYKKIAATMVLGAGTLVIVCAIVKSFYLISVRHYLRSP